MGRAPTCIITDQDPAVKIAVAQEFPMARHRYCMWHIMTKVGEKVGRELSKNNRFRKALDSVVWNEWMTVEDFEVKWHSIIVEYGLQENRWFSQQYEQRAYWIPAYFRDVYMGGLLRTTSRSEAENSAYKSASNHHSGLMEFFMHFENVVEKQRRTQAQLNASCIGHQPEMKTPLQIERQAAAIYTIKIFYEVQAEIYAGCFTCRIQTVCADGLMKSYVVDDKERKASFDVVLDMASTTVNCTCKMFTRVGLFCRHIFLVLKDADIEQITPKYIISRWTRMACMPATQNIPGVQERKSTSSSSATNDMSNVWNQFYKCVAAANNNNERLTKLGRVLQDQYEDFCGKDAGEIAQTKQNTVIEAYYGASSPTVVTVHPPPVAKNKGSGKRLKSAKEISAKQNAKAKRVCRTCNMFATHDSRNCPNA